MKQSTVIVPLRINSKSIPKKNIKLLGGKPMCAWVLEAASRSASVGQIIVSTESQEIMDVVSALKLPVDLVRRPDQLAGDKSSTESVMLHALDACRYDTIMLIQATSPLISTQDIDSALHKYWDNGYDSLLSAVRTKAFFWSDDGRPLNYDPLHRPMRQDFAGCLQENGALYITTRPALLASQCRLSGRTGVFEMSQDSAVELDEPEDWVHVGRILERRASSELPRASEIPRLKYIVCDVDGTLTDGGMYYSSDGEALKKFNTRDAVGLAQLKDQGVCVVVVTAEESASVSARMRKLHITEYYSGVKDKLAFLESYVASAGCSWAEVGYIGDDLNDISAMKRARWVACPADACPEVQSLAHYRCRAKGGEGAVREVCQVILAAALERACDRG